jgi:hypothetical protein
MSKTEKQNLLNSISITVAKLNQFGDNNKHKSYCEAAVALPTFCSIKYEDIRTEWEQNKSIHIFYIVRNETYNNYYLLNPGSRDDMLRIIHLFKPSRPQKNIVFYKPSIALLNWLNSQYVKLERILKLHEPRMIKYYNTVNYIISGFKRRAPVDLTQNAPPKRHNDGKSLISYKQQTDPMDTTSGGRRRNRSVNNVLAVITKKTVSKGR